MAESAFRFSGMQRSVPLLVELLLLRRAGQRLDAGRPALDNGGDVVEVADAHFLLVRDEGVALLARLEFRLLHCFMPSPRA